MLTTLITGCCLIFVGKEYIEQWTEDSTRSDSSSMQILRRRVGRKEGPEGPYADPSSGSAPTKEGTKN